MATMPDNPVSDLVLVRLLAATTNGLTAAQVARALHPILESAVRSSRLSDEVASALRGLADTGYVTEPTPDAGGAKASSKTKTPRYRLTESGRARALEYLGASYLPSKVDWGKHLKKTYLPAKALGVRIDSSADLKRMAGAAGLLAGILKEGQGLPEQGRLSERAVLDAVLWRALDVVSDRPFTLGEVKAHLYGKLLGLEGPIEEKRGKTQLAARAVDARQPNADGLRQALVERLVGGGADADARHSDATDSHAPSKHVEKGQSAHGAAAPPADLKAFAARVLEAARTSPTGQFGMDKVFIAHVWRQFERLGHAQGMTEDEFKQRLLAAHRANELTLSGADRISRMDPEDVRASAVSYLNAEFHFVRIPEG